MNRQKETALYMNIAGRILLLVVGAISAVLMSQSHGFVMFINGVVGVVCTFAVLFLKWPKLAE